MSLIDQLISIKKTSSSDDILTMMDEFILYGRLSRSSALGNINESPVLQKRLPLIYKAVQENIYELSLFFMSATIMQHLTGEIPDHILNHMSIVSDIVRQRLTIAQASTMSVEYHELSQYSHALYEEYVVAVYTNDIGPVTNILIITHHNKMYNIFQGHYTAPTEDELEVVQNDIVTSVNLEPLVRDINGAILSLETYSAQGNNGYFFASYIKDGISKYLMLPDNNTLWLSTVRQLDDVDDSNLEIVPLDVSESSRLMMTRHDPGKFIDALALILSRWEGD